MAVAVLTQRASPGFRDRPVPSWQRCRGAAHVSAESHATDWTVPTWAATHDTVDPAVAWAALDCTSGIFAGLCPSFQLAVTGELAVHIARPLTPGERLAIAANDADDPAGWQGRTRRIAAAAFDTTGATVARALSTWVALRPSLTGAGDPS